MNLLRMILPLSLFAICGFAQDVRYNFAAGTDFSKLKTYKWVQIKGADQVNQLAEQQLKQAVDAELVKRVWRKPTAIMRTCLSVTRPRSARRSSLHRSVPTGATVPAGAAGGMAAAWGRR